MKKREEDIETFFKTLSESQLKDAKVRWTILEAKL